MWKKWVLTRTEKVKLRWSGNNMDTAGKLKNRAFRWYKSHCCTATGGVPRLVGIKSNTNPSLPQLLTCLPSVRQPCWPWLAACWSRARSAVPPSRRWSAPPGSIRTWPWSDTAGPACCQTQVGHSPRIKSPADNLHNLSLLTDFHGNTASDHRDDNDSREEPRACLHDDAPDCDLSLDGDEADFVLSGPPGEPPGLCESPREPGQYQTYARLQQEYQRLLATEREHAAPRWSPSICVCVCLSVKYSRFFVYLWVDN